MKAHIEKSGIVKLVPESCEEALALKYVSTNMRACEDCVYAAFKVEVDWSILNSQRTEGK